MKIILLLYIFSFIFCSTEIYNITFSEGLEINNRNNGRQWTPKPVFCDESNDFYLRLKINDLNNAFFIKFKVDKTNNFNFKEVKAYGFTSYPSDKELTDDISNPLDNVLNGEFWNANNYEYYTYEFLAHKDLKYASVSIHIENNNCDYIGIITNSKQN